MNNRSVWAPACLALALLFSGFGTMANAKPVIDDIEIEAHDEDDDPDNQYSIRLATITVEGELDSNVVKVLGTVRIIDKALSGDGIDNDSDFVVDEPGEGNLQFDIQITPGSLTSGGHELRVSEGTRLIGNMIETNDYGEFVFSFVLPINVPVNDTVILTFGNEESVLEDPIYDRDMIENDYVGRRDFEFGVQTPVLSEGEVDDDAYINGDRVEIQLEYESPYNAPPLIESEEVELLTILPDFSNVDSVFALGNSRDIHGNPLNSLGPLPNNEAGRYRLDRWDEYNYDPGDLDLYDLALDVDRALKDGRLYIDARGGDYELEYMISDQNLNLSGRKRLFVYAIDYPFTLDIFQARDIFFAFGLNFPDFNVAIWATCQTEECYDYDMGDISFSRLIHVPGDYPKIQQGIDAALDWDIVLVASGEYKGFGNVNLDFHGKSITVRSEHGPESCVIDCENTPGVCGFYFHSNEDSDSIVKGFTIQNGSVSSGSGGGIYCYYSSPVIRDNYIIRNSSSLGAGGIFCYQSSPRIIDNLIAENSTNGSGSGIVCSDSSSPLIMDNIIKDNSATAGGGGIYCGSGSSPVIANNVIIDNVSYALGGGIFCYNSSPLIISNTVAGNSGYALFCADNSSPTIINTILWENGLYEVYFNSIGAPNTITVSSSDVRGGQSGINTNNNGTVNWLAGNINFDPLFVNPINDDYHLSDFSKCIGAGTMTEDTPDDDIENNDRPDPDDTNPDIGAYENMLSRPAQVIVTIPDPNLENVIREELERPTGDITDALLAILYELPGDGQGISNLTGLEYCVNLRELELNENHIVDINPLANLTNLEDLELHENQISDVSPLANLINLEDLELDENQISNISPLASLTTLDSLELDNNQIADISPLANLTNLGGLSLSGNQISDIGALENLTYLGSLHLSSNQISDISALENLTHLYSLSLASNQIREIGVLENLTNLQLLNLGGNRVVSIEPLTNLTYIGTLYLYGNRISDITPVANLTYLWELDLGNNQISDISPLVGLPILRKLHLYGNQISNIDPLASLTNLDQLYLEYNQVSDISPLVNNTGLREGDVVSLRDNPLNNLAYTTHIPALQARGVVVYFDPPGEFPILISFEINNGATETANSTVILNNAAERNPTHYMADEDPDFDGAIWKPYSTAPSFTLSPSPGIKTVYLKLKNNAGESSIRSDSIKYIVIKVDLYPGWNPISLPLQPQNADPDAVLVSISGKYESVWAYDPNTGWTVHVPGGVNNLPGGISNLNELVTGRGYFIRMTEPGILTFEGEIIQNTSISLEGEEWNLVGYNSLEPKQVEDCISSVEDSIDYVWGYDTDNGWVIYIPDGISGLDFMKPGYGYWVKADQGCEWDISLSHISRVTAATRTSLP